MHAIFSSSFPQRRIAYFSTLVFVCASMLAGCGGGDTSPVSGTPNTPSGPAPGTLQSAQALDTINPDAIVAAMNQPGSQISGLAPRYSVRSYRLTYYTTDKSGKVVLASGLLSVPVKKAGAASPMLGYQHATIFHNADAPSFKVQPAEPPIVYASLGYIVVAADSIGFGASQGQDHPYLIWRPTAQAVVDMLQAARTWAGDNKVADNGQLFLTGYSEGGYATMAVHRLIQQNGGDWLTRLKASVPGAGPYDVQATMDAHLDSVRAISPELARLISPGNLSRLDERTRKELRRLLLRQIIPSDSDVAYDANFLDNYMADDKDAIVRDNSVHLGWAPTASVSMFHGRQDRTVPFAASVSALNAWHAQGATNVSLTECSAQPSDHMDCVPEFVHFSVARMGQLAGDL